MNLNQYTIKGDPQQLLATWRRATEGFGKEEYFLNLVAVQDDGLIILDVCPTEADFQGWINGDDWRHLKAELGGDVVVTRLGELAAGVVRDSVVEVVHAHAHAH